MSFLFSDFPCFFVGFSFLFQDYRGSATRETLAFFGVSLFFPKKQGLEAQGICQGTRNHALVNHAFARVTPAIFVTFRRSPGV